MSLQIKDCTEVERTAFDLIRETFLDKFPDLIVREISGDDETAIFLQKHLGDLLWINKDPLKHSGVSFAEVKAERKFTGNLFIETWSNWSDEPSRLNPGWATKAKGHWVFYVFLDRMTLYMFPRTPLLRFAWSNHAKYKEATQEKHQQRNVTRGLLVPITDIEKYLCETESKFRIIELCSRTAK